MMNKPTISILREPDQDFFLTLENLTKVGSIKKSRAKSILKKIERNDAAVFIAKKEGSVVGTIMVIIEQHFIHEGGLVGHIHDVTVRKGYEGQGIGSLLVRRAVSYAKKRGCYKVVLECCENNVAFYEKSGFHKHEISMRRNLQ